MVQLVQQVPAMGRVGRYPSHPFHLISKPYDIVPCFIAPVLAGETLKNLLLQSRVVSDPVKNPLMGWWQEYYFFYIKLRDLPQRDKLTQMLLNPAEDMSSLKLSTRSFGRNTFAGGMDWVGMCRQKVVEEYFRDEGKPYNEFEINGHPQAYAHGADESWLDSLTLDAAMPEYDPNDTSMQADELLRAQWEFMRAQKMTQMSFEDYLRSFGVTAVQEPNRPELIRYIREWTYPSNTVNPADGTPSSALSWSIQERADKDRFFKEPGFLFGVSVTRPKLYLSNVHGTLSGAMDNALAWLPAIMSDQPETSLRQFATGTGPLPGLTDAGGYWVDIRDLLLYGEQYLNFSLGDTTISADRINQAALPTVAGVFKSLTDAERTALFTAAGKNWIRQDGMIKLSILGTQVETT